MNILRSKKPRVVRILIENNSLSPGQNLIALGFEYVDLEVNPRKSYMIFEKNHIRYKVMGTTPGVNRIISLEAVENINVYKK